MIYLQLEPEDHTGRYAWLFDLAPVLPEGKDEDWNAREQKISGLRQEAVRAVHKVAGLTGVLELVSVVQQPSELGAAVAGSRLIEEAEEQLLLRDYLTSDAAAYASFASGLASALVWSRGLDAMRAQSLATWSAIQKCESPALTASVPTAPESYPSPRQRMTKKRS